MRHGCHLRRSCVLLGALVLAAGVTAQPPAEKAEPLPAPRAVADDRPPPPGKPIDLATALRLAGVQNPEILIARERVEQAAARRQLAAAQLLPTLNAGGNLDHHTGRLQRSNGQIIDVNRDSLYLGLGAGAVGGGTVTIPGLSYNLHLSQALFTGLVSRQRVQQRIFESEAVRNEVLLETARAYLDLLWAAGRRAIALQNRDEVAEVARITANFARTGQGRQSDADRAATELELRNTELLDAEGDLATASARLSQLLSIDPSGGLYPIDGWVVPSPIVPDPVPLPELLTIALTQRPELKARQVAIRSALLRLRGAKLMPFSPNILFGYSAGVFGGGSNLVEQGIVQPDGTLLQQSRFGNFDDRQDLDVVFYWSLRNLGLGNLAITRAAQSNVRRTELRLVEELDRVRAEVASAYARAHARYAQLDPNERAVEVSRRAFEGDLRRTRNREGLPIEVLDSLRLLGRSRYGYLEAIVEYNRAQFDLYVALGNPPADCLARPVPAALVPPPAVGPAGPAEACPPAAVGPAAIVAPAADAPAFGVPETK